jgi:hypothetical protein
MVDPCAAPRLSVFWSLSQGRQLWGPEPKENIMSNTQQASTIEQPIGVIRTSFTVGITFTNKPSEELRRKMKEAGYKFENGNWYKNQSEGKLATQETVDQLLAA